MSKVIDYKPDQLCLGLILAPFECAFGAVEYQIGSIKSRPFTVCNQRIKWPEFFTFDGHLYDIMRAEIALFSVSKRVTAYVCNLADGWNSLYSNIIESRNFDAFLFRTTFSVGAIYPIFEMKVWRLGQVNRHIRVFYDDDGWGFINNGHPLSFEDLNMYEKRFIKNRLDRDAIDRYSLSVGLSINSVTNIDDKCIKFFRK